LTSLFTNKIWFYPDAFRVFYQKPYKKPQNNEYSTIHRGLAHPLPDHQAAIGLF
jgi:hypothetical protein